MKKEIAVIILNWNGENLLRKFIPSVFQNTNSKIADIIVADNGSSDNSIQYLEQNFPEIKIIAFPENYGFAEGYNKAIEKTDYKYTILLNSDVHVTRGWLEPMYEYCENNPDTAACQPKILSYHDKSKFEYAGAAGGFLDKTGYPFCRGRIFSKIEPDNGQYDSIVDIFWASGAALFVRTKIYNKAGGLDKYFFAHMEEIDLCWRMQLLGYKIKVIPQSKVYHLGGGSLPASNPKKTYLNFRNNLLLLYKNLPPKDGQKKLFIRRLYDTLAFFMFCLKLDLKNAIAILKAHNDFRKMKKLYDNHPETNLLKKLPETKRNIIFDYFILNKKTY